MRSTVPDGDLATIIDEAVTSELARLEKRKSASTQKPLRRRDRLRHSQRQQLRRLIMRSGARRPQ